jgi:hypothetical protein
MFDERKTDVYKTPHIDEVGLRNGYGDRSLKDIPLNAPCKICGKKDTLPYRCSYCGEIFCGDHRLPETHNCVLVNPSVIVIPPGLEPPSFKPIDDPAPKGYYVTEEERVDASDAKSMVTEKVVVMGKFNNIDKSLVEIYDLVNEANNEELSELKKHLGAIEDILAKIDAQRD